MSHYYHHPTSKNQDGMNCILLNYLPYCRTSSNLGRMCIYHRCCSMSHRMSCSSHCPHTSCSYFHKPGIDFHACSMMHCSWCSSQPSHRSRIPSDISSIDYTRTINNILTRMLYKPRFSHTARTQQPTPYKHPEEHISLSFY